MFTRPRVILRHDGIPVHAPHLLRVHQPEAGARDGGVPSPDARLRHHREFEHPAGRERTRADGMGRGGGGVVVNQVINISTGVQQTVRAEIRQLMPQIADSAKAAVSDAKRRGGSYGRAFA